MCAPSVWSIVLGSVAVVGGLTLASYAVYFGFTARNPLWFLQALGSLAFVAGVVGQRAYYLGADQVANGCTKTVSPHPGLWDASVTLPIISIHLDYVSVIGVFITALGFCLMMFFEPQRRSGDTAPVTGSGEAS
jgi:hypothetical protein